MKIKTLPLPEAAFHGFMDPDNCCVNICYTPHAPGGHDNTLATGYYTDDQLRARDLQVWNLAMETAKGVCDELSIAEECVTAIEKLKEQQ